MGGAALDVLLTDAAMGNPAQRIARQPGALVKTAARVGLRPDRVARRAASFTKDVAEITRGSSEIAPPRGDKRFADPAWQKNWLFRRVAQTYIAAGTHADGLIDDADLDWRADTMARFVTGNVHDLLSPTNFPWSNPAVLKETLDQGGANLVKGVRRAGRDIGARRLPAMVDTSRFEVGGNVAVTPGAVVLRTDVFELIQYAPTTARVRPVPLLMVPPTINKYYVLDLAPGRSMVEYLIAQGQQVFMISWRNPGAEQGHYDFDTYADAVVQAREAVAQICRQEQVHLAAACSGGIITSGLAGHLAATGKLDDSVASLTLLVCALDNARAGTASALAGRELAAAAVAESARKGYLDGKALANVFAWLRPNDLVWGYVINNYLMGKPPPAFDILYWNQDGVRLSAGLHRDFVHMALDNTMTKAGGMTVLGSPVDLRKVKLDAYVVAGLNDHIVPWENAYRGAKLFGGAPRFVLSTSGHIQALINPPTGWAGGGESRSNFRVSEELPDSEAEFVRDVPRTSGSWWGDHAKWLAARSGDLRPPRKTLGSTKHKPLAKAPGSYVHAA
ncbi:Poly(3-hydroxyalkanoate) polymerase subunit PhaC [Paraconexibacter sp. AEG42_29]|uniref:Poly(3-hydroxyalkanoate) polymerase subunit PhaC n=1 Tax=Paraconexibacter sp. AEG42_29 TaxID=2997339 RepID=A0AAU7AZ71_9ACTN